MPRCPLLCHAVRSKKGTVTFGEKPGSVVETGCYEQLIETGPEFVLRVRIDNLCVVLTRSSISISSALSRSGEKAHRVLINVWGWRSTQLSTLWHRAVSSQHRRMHGPVRTLHCHEE